MIRHEQLVEKGVLFIPHTLSSGQQTHYSVCTHYKNICSDTNAAVAPLGMRVMYEHPHGKRSTKN